jgi:hypothetical protein
MTTACGIQAFGVSLASESAGALDKDDEIATIFSESSLLLHNLPGWCSSSSEEKGHASLCSILRAKVRYLIAAKLLERSSFGPSYGVSYSVVKLAAFAL